MGQTYLPDSTDGTIGVNIAYTVTDGYASSDAGEINLSYEESLPVAQDVRVVVSVGATAESTFIVQALNGFGFDGEAPFVDPDGDVLHAILESNPAHGTIAAFQDGVVTYQESRPYLTDSFTYKLSDGYEESNTATVTLVPQRQAPTLYPDELANSPGQTPGSRDPLSNDYFPDLTPVFGHGQAILVNTDYFRLLDLSGHMIQPGDPIDFKNGFTLDPTGFLATSHFTLTYNVRYDLNDDPDPPTADTVYATTVTIVSYRDPQSDTDGVSDAVENGAPNGGDGNGDHIPDSQQDNVASLPDSTDGQFVTLASDPSTYLAEVKATLNPSPSDVPPGYEFPLGFFTFELFGPFFSTVGGVKKQVDSTFVDLISPIELPPPPNFHYYRYGKTPDHQSDHWYDFTYDGQTGAELLSTHEIRLHFVDGGRGDDDLMENGVIMDAGGPAILLPSLVTVTSLEPTRVKVTTGAGKMAKTKTETALVLGFSDDLKGTGNSAAYQLLTGKTRKGATTFHTPVPVTVLSSTPKSVTLLPRHTLKRSRPAQLRLVAADLTDAFGRPLAGGQNFVLKVGKTVVTDAGAESQSRNR
jgi:hypothetical protein